MNQALFLIIRNSPDQPSKSQTWGQRINRLEIQKESSMCYIFGTAFKRRTSYDFEHLLNIICDRAEGPL